MFHPVRVPSETISHRYFDGYYVGGGCVASAGHHLCVARSFLPQRQHLVRSFVPHVLPNRCGSHKNVHVVYRLVWHDGVLVI